MIFSKIPNISRTAVKFPYISRFSRQVVTLYSISLVHHVCARSTCICEPQCINLLGSCCNLLLSQASRHLLSNFRSQCCFGFGLYNRITYLVGTPTGVQAHNTITVHCSFFYINPRWTLPVSTTYYSYCACDLPNNVTGNVYARRRRPSSMFLAPNTWPSVAVCSVQLQLTCGTVYQRQCSLLSYETFCDAAWKLNCSSVLTADTAPVKQLYCCLTHFHFPCSFLLWSQTFRSTDYNVGMTFILNNNNNNNSLCQHVAYFSNLFTYLLTL